METELHNNHHGKGLALLHSITKLPKNQELFKTYTLLATNLPKRMEELIKGAVDLDRLNEGLNAPKGKRIFLGIGINAYDTMKGWTPLNNAVRDMTALADVLQERYDFKKKILVDLEATKSNIEQELYKLTNTKELGENDSLLIYYSGHGHLDDNQLGYWVPVDAQKTWIATYLPNSRILELISVIKCKHLLLISDACFSGSVFDSELRGQASGLVAEEYEKRASRWAFCSGRNDQMVSDGPIGGHSPFAAAILQELILNPHKLNIAPLAIRVTEITRAAYNQMPDANPLKDPRHKGGQFVFTPVGIMSDTPILLPSLPTGYPENIENKDIKFDKNNFKQLTIAVAGTGIEWRLTDKEEWICEELGKMIAEEQFNLITGGWKGVDYLVAKNFSKGIVNLYNHRLSEHLIQVVPKNKKPQFEGGMIVSVDNEISEWIETLRRADVIILVGGVGGTYDAFKFAQQERVPIFPICGTNRDSEKIFNEMITNWDSSLIKGVDRSTFIENLQIPIDERADAIQIVSNIKKLLLILKKE